MKIFKMSQEKKQKLIEDIVLLVECKDWDVFKLKRAIAGRCPFPLFDLMMWLKFEDEHGKLFKEVMQLHQMKRAIGVYDSSECDKIFS